VSSQCYSLLKQLRWSSTRLATGYEKDTLLATCRALVCIWWLQSDSSGWNALVWIFSIGCCVHSRHVAVRRLDRLRDFQFSNHRRSQGGQRSHALQKFLENIDILCFERRFSKQNSVVRLKSKILRGPKFLGWLRHCFKPPHYCCSIHSLRMFPQFTEIFKRRAYDWRKTIMPAVKNTKYKKKLNLLNLCEWYRS